MSFAGPGPDLETHIVHKIPGSFPAGAIGAIVAVGVVLAVLVGAGWIFWCRKRSATKHRKGYPAGVRSPWDPPQHPRVCSDSLHKDPEQAVVQTVPKMHAYIPRDLDPN